MVHSYTWSMFLGEKNKFVNYLYIEDYYNLLMKYPGANFSIIGAQCG